jgi:dUTP pyrophosphatase
MFNKKLLKTTQKLQKGTPTSAGFDLVITAFPPQYKDQLNLSLPPGVSLEVSLGLQTEFPSDVVALVFPRSGLGNKGLAVMNTVGVIDSDYRGVWRATLVNTGAKPIPLEIGQRVLQAVFIPLAKLTQKVVTVAELSDSNRGAGGFGSTGH